MLQEVKIMNGNKKIGQRIRKIRAERGYGKKDFARMLEITVERLEEIENGTTEYQFRTLEKVASALGVNLPELLDFEM